MLCRRSKAAAATRGKSSQPGGRPTHAAFYFHDRKVGDTMFIFGNFLVAAAKVLSLALNLYMWIVIARAVLSWVNPDPYNPIVRFIHTLTEPVLYQVRRRLPVVFGGVDLAPVVVLLAILFLEHFVVASLYELAAGLR
jgi:YggT family protein